MSQAGPALGRLCGAEARKALGVTEGHAGDQRHCLLHLPAGQGQSGPFGPTGCLSGPLKRQGCDANRTLRERRRRDHGLSIRRHREPEARLRPGQGVQRGGGNRHSGVCICVQGGSQRHAEGQKRTRILSSSFSPNGPRTKVPNSRPQSSRNLAWTRPVPRSRPTPKRHSNFEHERDATIVKSWDISRGNVQSRLATSPPARSRRSSSCTFSPLVPRSRRQLLSQLSGSKQNTAAEDGVIGKIALLKLTEYLEQLGPPTSRSRERSRGEV